MLAFARGIETATELSWLPSAWELVGGALMIVVAFVCAVLLALGVILFARTRRRPAALLTDDHSMRRTLERKVREGADFQF